MPTRNAMRLLLADDDPNALAAYELLFDFEVRSLKAQKRLRSSGGLTLLVRSTIRALEACLSVRSLPLRGVPKAPVRRR